MLGDEMVVSGEKIPRRGLLKKGLLGGALLTIGGAVPIALRSSRLGPPPQKPLRLFTPTEHAIFAAVAARIVPGDGAGPRWPSAAAMDCAGKADAQLALCHQEVGREFQQLLRLFENGLLSLFSGFGPTPFTRLSPVQQDARLERWRRSRLPLFRTGYQAMARLAHATYYGSPEVHHLVGYPGPPEVPAF